MLGKRQKLKYEIVNNLGDDDVEIETVKKKIVTNPCIWSSVCTILLISLYFVPSIGLTFYQRWLYQKFEYPLITVLIHMFVKLLLAAFIRFLISFKIPKPKIEVEWEEYLLAVVPTGVFSGLDIGFSNWGLGLIYISLYSMTKSTTIIFILAFAILFKLEKKSWSLCTTIVMISIGLFLFTYKATQFNLLGFVLILLASVCSGLRWSCVQLLLQKSKLEMKNPIDMILHMQPWMILSLLPFAAYKEGSVITNELMNKEFDEFMDMMSKILIGAVIAFFMEVTEVLVVTYTSSLTLSIAGIFKEIIIITLAVVYNGDQMSIINQIGLLICLFGITSHVVHKIKNNALRQQMKLYELSDKGGEMGESLLKHAPERYVPKKIDDDHDSQKLLDLLNRHDR